MLVLDEATSNLDLQSETKIEAALDVLLEARTAVLIAHRLTTAMKADRIVVVDDGRIVELGSHDELVARGGRYAEMYAMWVRAPSAQPRPRRRLGGLGQDSTVASMIAIAARDALCASARRSRPFAAATTSSSRMPPTMITATSGSSGRASKLGMGLASGLDELDQQPREPLDHRHAGARHPAAERRELPDEAEVQRRPLGARSRGRRRAPVDLPLRGRRGSTASASRSIVSSLVCSNSARKHASRSANCS